MGKGKANNDQKNNISNTEHNNSNLKINSGRERSPIHLRSRNKIQKVSSTSVHDSKAKANSSNNSLEKAQSDVFENQPEDFLISLGLLNVNYNINIDPNIVDRYTNIPASSLTGLKSTLSESADKNRCEEENMVVARQGRLHPSNVQLNQGPVENPPLISPGTIVGYTPAGQRHEVDLNLGRPTWFNSEYARRQFDDATRINVSRMMHELENGRFLPNTLDPDIERRYFAERELATVEAREHFEKCVIGTFDEELEENDNSEELSVLQTEALLINTISFAVAKLNDFPEELARKLNKALSYKITPLMMKKHPIILQVLTNLTKQRQHPCVIVPAKSLLNKFKELFDVPPNLTFHDVFFKEVKKLEKITENLSYVDTLILTEESSYLIENSSDQRRSSHDQEGNVNSEEEIEAEDEWIAIENRDILWVDQDEQILENAKNNTSPEDDNQDNSSSTEMDFQDERSDEESETGSQHESEFINEE